MSDRSCKKKYKTIAIIRPALIILCFSLFSILSAGCGVGSLIQEEMSNTVRPSELPKEQMSEDQNKLIRAFGYPDEFFIVFDEGGSLKRVETWLYQAMESSFKFEDGYYSGREQVITDELIPDVSGVLPEDFTSEMDPDMVRMLVGDKGTEYVDEETGLKAVIFADFQLVCVFSPDDELMNVTKAKKTFEDNN